MNPFKIFTCLLIAMLASGCNTVVKLNVKHAPQIDLGAAHTLAVEDFSVDGQVNLDMGEEHDSLRNMLKRSIASGLAAPSDPGVQKHHHAALVEALLQNGHFRVIEGMGDVTLSGHVSYKVNDSLTEREWKDAESGKKMEEYTLKRITTAEVSFQVTDARGIVLGASRVQDSIERKWEAKSAGEAREQARNQPVADDVLNAVASTTAPLVRKIAPYFVLENRELEDGKSDRIAQGNKAAEAGRWEQAAELWRPLLSSQETKDRNAAMYNLAIYDEYSERLDAALLKLDQLYADTRENKFGQAADRMRQRIREARQMQENERGRRTNRQN